MSPSGMIHVLVVEDVDAMRHLMSMVLSDIPEIKLSGLAQNSMEARIELSRRRPHLVLLDEVLPGESSLDLLQELIAQQIPVLLLSGLEDQDRLIPPGALGRLQKPGWDDLDADRARFRALILSALGRSPESR